MKNYTTPELEIMEFELEDIITVSTGAGEWNENDNGWY